MSQVDWDNLNSQTVVTLRKLAKENNVPYSSKTKKAELVVKLIEYHSSQQTPEIQNHESPLPTVLNIPSALDSNPFQNETPNSEIVVIPVERSPTPVNHTASRSPTPLKKSRSPSPAISARSPKKSQIFSTEGILLLFSIIAFIIILLFVIFKLNKMTPPNTNTTNTNTKI